MFADAIDADFAQAELVQDLSWRWITNTFSPEIRARAARLFQDHEHDHSLRWAAIMSILAKIGCTGQTLNECVKMAEMDAGTRAGVLTDIAASDRLSC